MRFAPLAAVAVIVAVSTCTPNDTGRVAAPRIAGAHDGDFAGAPDLIVDGKALEGSWVVYDQILKEGTCTLEEGGVLDPTVPHRVVRFTVNTPNIGDADIALGDPAVHVAAGDGLYRLSTCHQHWHFQHYATYELVDPVSGKVWQAAKRGFCMIDVVPWNGGIQSPGPWVYHVCGRPAGPPAPWARRSWATKESAPVARISTTSGSAGSISCWMAATGKCRSRLASISSAST